MSEDRLVDIESKLAHQDKLLLDLNDVVAAQQEQIMRLEQLCQTLIDRVRAMSEAMPNATTSDERPPHY